MLTQEELITFAQAARLLPHRRGGRSCHTSTVWRWALRGVCGVKLESLLCGGTRCTSRAALFRFFEACTAARDAALGAAQYGDAPLRTPAVDDARAQAAQQALAEELAPKKRGRKAV